MLMRQVGIEPRLEAPDVDEEAVIAKLERAESRVLPPAEHVLVLAQHKARDVAHRLAAEGFEGIVIGGDSMFELGGEIFGKPLTPENATARWRSMRGKTGVLHSGHSVIAVENGVLNERNAVAEARVSFAHDITDEEIATYVATGEPLQVAGAFTVDSLGGAFIDRVDGDPSTVVGMSLSTVRRLIVSLGFSWTSLWNRTD